MLSSNISKHQQSIYDTQEKIASGKRINRPSDDPSSYELIKSLETDAFTASQYARNANRVNDELTMQDQTIQQVIEVLQRSSELCVSSTNTTLDSGTLQSMGEEVDQLLSQMLQLANSSSAGRYIFGGTETQTKPYATSDTNGDGRVDLAEITYQGNQEVRNIEIARKTYIEANVPGSNPTGSNAVFVTSSVNLFDSLIQLRDRLLAGTTPSVSHMENIEDGLEHAINTLTLVGARQQRVETSLQFLSNKESLIQKSLEKESSLDIAKAMVNLSKSKTAYQAAINTTSSILNQRTLLDYM